jgi:hypothetical protein
MRTERRRDQRKGSDLDIKHFGGMFKINNARDVLTDEATRMKAGFNM